MHVLRITVYARRHFECDYTTVHSSTGSSSSTGSNSSSERAIAHTSKRRSRKEITFSIFIFMLLAAPKTRERARAPQTCAVRRCASTDLVTVAIPVDSPPSRRRRQRRRRYITNANWPNIFQMSSAAFDFTARTTFAHGALAGWHAKARSTACEEYSIIHVGILCIRCTFYTCRLHICTIYL